ncbi:hypothetical protein ACFL7D_00475 [candidate division KSB1 bacterium]
MKRYQVCILITLVFFVFSSVNPSDCTAQKKNYDKILGTWDAAGDYGGTPFNFMFIFNTKDDTLKGSWSAEMMMFNLTKTTFENDTLKAEMYMDFGEQGWSISISAAVENEKMTGYMGSEMGNMSFSATRRKNNK